MSNKSSEAYFKGLSPVDRITALRENAVEKYNKNVIRHYSEEELTEMKHRLSDEDIKIDDAEEEKRALTKELSKTIKEHKTVHTSLLKGIKNKYWESFEEVFDLANQEEGVMETYDCEGNLVNSRRLTPSEKQIRTFDIHTKTA